MASAHSAQCGSIGLLLLLGVGLLCTPQDVVSTATRADAGHALHGHRGLDKEGLGRPTARTTPTGFFALLGAGLLTGLSHCVGMCGPLVGAFTMRRRATRRDLSTPLVFFQLGRLLTYSVLGAVVGSVGAVYASAVQAWQGLFAISMGGLVIASGAGLLGLIPLQHWLASVIPVQWLYTRVTACLDSQHPAAPFSLGMANGFLPCGAVYTMVLLAAMSADPLKGASLMFVFGFGTLPAMLGVGFSIGLLSTRLRYRLSRAAALLVVVVGVQLTLRGLALEGYIAHTGLGGLMLW